jgi:hypothetical protein
MRLDVQGFEERISRINVVSEAENHQFTQSTY